MAKADKFLNKGAKAPVDDRPLEEREPGYAASRARNKAKSEDAKKAHEAHAERLKKAAKDAQKSTDTPAGA